MKRIYIAYLLVFLGIIFGSTGPNVIFFVMKEVERDVSVAIFLLLGGMACFFVEFLDCLYKKESFFNSVKNVTIVPKKLWIVAGVSMGAIYSFYVRALQLGSISETMLVYRIGPFLSILLATCILGEKIKNWKLLLIATAVCLFGTVITKGFASFNPEVFFDSFMIFTLLAAIVFSLRKNLERYIQKEWKVSIKIIVGVMMLIGGALVSIYALFISGAVFTAPSLSNIAWLGYVGTATSALPIILNLKAYEILGNYSRVAYLEYLIPICGATIAFFMHGEKEIFSFFFWIGFGVISFGIFLADKSVKKRKTILFVCNGNIHRSVVAEICLKQELKKLGFSEKYAVISRGIQGCCGTVKPKYDNLTHYETEWFLTRPILERLGINLQEISTRIAKSVQKRDIQEADVIYAMELAVLGKNNNDFPNSLLTQFPEYSSRMHFFGDIEGDSQELVDCAESKNQEVHTLVNERIVYGIRNNMQKILNHVDSGGKK
ncbi:MAG: EamA family transporter [bacterium]|nr:EamA family transporter [bacterium]